MDHSILLKTLRAAKDFPQLKVATTLNITQQAYSVKENNPDNLTLEELKKIAELYETDVPTLLSGDLNKILPPRDK